MGKILKIRSDMLFLLLLKDVERHLVVLTENDMYDRCLKERDSGRVPREIEFAYAEIPQDLQQLLVTARAASSTEVSPKGRRS
ncbi:Putative cytosolic signal transduction protein (fragment) [Burkholderiales bacterium]